MLIRMAWLFALWLLPPEASATWILFDVHAAESEHRPTWISMPQVRPGSQRTVKSNHFSTATRPSLHAVPAGVYRIDHFDFTETPRGNHLTRYVSFSVPVTLEPGAVNYLGDLSLINGRLMRQIQIETLLQACRVHAEIMAGASLAIWESGRSMTKIDAICPPLE